jgi:hypothetical protein
MHPPVGGFLCSLRRAFPGGSLADTATREKFDSDSSVEHFGYKPMTTCAVVAAEMAKRAYTVRATRDKDDSR